MYVYRIMIRLMNVKLHPSQNRGPNVLFLRPMKRTKEVVNMNMSCELVNTGNLKIRSCII